jgi:hypothetical protein
MSIVFLIKRDGMEAPYGFSKLDHNTFMFFESNQYGKTKALAETSDGKIAFPEDFPNKRAYLQKVKSKGWKRFSGYYHLTAEAVILLKSMGSGTIFSSIDISEFDHQINDFEKISPMELSPRAILKYGSYYIISEQVK